MYGAEDTSTGDRKEVQVARMSLYADESLVVTMTAELLEVVTTRTKQGEFVVE